MRRETLAYLLALSVLFNVGALAAAAWRASTGTGPAGVSLPSYLDLDAAQRQRWGALEQSFLAGLDVGWHEIARERELLLTEVFGTAPDPQRIEAARRRIAALQATQQQRVIAQLLQEREVLRAPQRDKLLKLLLREDPQPVTRERKLHGS